MPRRTNNRSISQPALPGVGISGLLSACERCGKPFKPEPTGLKTRPMSTCCDECKCRNLLDGLGLPTPPDMLDRYSKKPALTEEEFRRKLKEDEDADDS